MKTQENVVRLHLANYHLNYKIAVYKSHFLNFGENLGNLRRHQYTALICPLHPFQGAPIVELEPHLRLRDLLLIYIFNFV